MRVCALMLAAIVAAAAGAPCDAFGQPSHPGSDKKSSADAALDSAHDKIVRKDSELRPLMLIGDRVLFADDFSEPREIIAKKPEEGDSWVPNQATRWVVEEGVLRGRPSTAEHQASKTTHKGLEPRILLLKTPRDYLMRFSFRIVGGKPFEAGKRGSVAPFIDLGHGVVRVTWRGNGASMLAEGATLQIANAPEFQLKPGPWYHVLVERRDDEAVLQFSDGSTLYGKHDWYKSDLHAFMLTGLEGGLLELDDVTVWSIRPGTQPGWAQRVAEFPPAEAIRIRPPRPRRPLPTKDQS